MDLSLLPPVSRILRSVIKLCKLGRLILLFRRSYDYWTGEYAGRAWSRARNKIRGSFVVFVISMHCLFQMRVKEVESGRSWF